MGKIFINIDFKNVGKSQNNLFDSYIFFYLKSLKIEKLIKSKKFFQLFSKIFFVISNISSFLNFV